MKIKWKPVSFLYALVVVIVASCKVTFRIKKIIHGCNYFSTVRATEV